MKREDDRSELLAATDLRALLVELTGTDARGTAYPCPSPEHDQTGRTPPVTVGERGGYEVWKCHACGLGGTAIDALMLARGLDTAGAFADLRQRTGKTNAPQRNTRRERAPDPLPTEQQFADWSQRLVDDGRLVGLAFQRRGWTRTALATLGVGVDSEAKRLTLPIRDRHAVLVNVCRYQPTPKGGERKMISLAGRPRDLFPAPETLEGGEVWLVEGEPDAIAAASLGLPAVGIPGVEFAKRLDVERFRRFRRVNVLLDCDTQGRNAAATVGARFAEAGIAARVLDLDPSRCDGYDLGDLVRDASQDGEDALRSVARMLERMAQDAAPVEREPAPETGRLLADVIDFVRQYVVLPGDAEAAAVALFVLHTWALDGAHATPYLLVVSPEKRSGKTRLLEVLALLVRSPWHTNSTSEAAMFRKIERDAPTLLLDEIDAVFGSASERTEPLRAILNSGNRRGVTVTRCAGKEHEVAEFSVWCPKVLAGIDKDRRLPETIRDRAISIRMRRRHDGENVIRFRERKAQALAAPIREAAAAWAAATTNTLYNAEPDLPGELGDRAADAWEPLFAIADLAGTSWSARARTAAIALGGNGEADETSLGTILLAALHRLMNGRAAASSHELLEEINADDELPFGGWNDGKGLDNRALARLLKPYGVRPRTVRIGEDTPRGYRAEDLRDTWKRYVPAECGAGRADNSGEKVQHAGSPQHEKPRHYGDVADVADVAPPASMGDGPHATSRDGCRSGDPTTGSNGSARMVADLGDDELLAIFPGASLEHVPTKSRRLEATARASTNGHVTEDLALVGERIIRDHGERL